MAPPPHKLATMVGWSASAFVAAVLARLIRKGIALLAELDEAAVGHLRRLEGLLAPVWRVLDAADAGAIDSSQRPIQDLLDAACSADDALDDLEYALLHTEVAGGGDPGSNASTPASVTGATRKPRSPMRFLLCFSPPRTASSAGSSLWKSSSRKRSSAVNVNLNGLREAFEAVAQAAYRCTSMYENVVPRKNYATIVSVKSPGDAVRDKYDIFGREAEVDQIVKTVRLGDDLRYRLGVGVLPVVGVEGVGKTALTQLIFHHEIIKAEFPVRMWAHVSGELLLSKQLMVQMIHPVVAGDAGHDIQDARELLLAQLAGKRFLLVLDHVTDVSDAQWRYLMELLQPAARRSLVMVTTQSEDAATAIGTMPQLMLGPLAFDDYWRMFKHFAFGAADEAGEDCTPLVDEWDDLEEEEEELSPMEQIACQIARSMDCSPLPARAIGRSLYFRRDEEGHWKDVLDDNLWQQGDIGGISPALWMSYQHLDPRLKQCFAYSAVFPGDYVFRKEELEQMWVAHGFIYSDDPASTLEDIAGEFFDELVERCFFQPLGRNRYVMHNTMQKLARAVSASQFHMVTDSSGEVPQEVRHLTIRTNNLLKLKMDLALQLSHPSDHHFLQRVRTILFFEDFGDSDDFLEVLAEVFSIAKSMRVLSLSFANISLLPAEIALLRHLRYLNLSRNRLSELPETMCQLRLLQVLDVKCNSPYLRPPNGMTNLIHLRHLRACEAFLSAIPDIQLLSNLQELEAICIKSSAHANALRQMVQLKGALRVVNLRRSDASGFKKGILKGTKQLNKLQHLNKLHLSWASSSMAGSNEVSADEEVLECLQPHEDIKILTVSGYAGIRSSPWMLKTSCSLPNVTSMCLTDCVNWESLPCLHDMPCLEVLEIKRMHSVNKVAISQLSDQELFPKLKRLIIEDASHFTGWSTGNLTRHMSFPCLCKLEIRNCPSLTTFPDVPLTLTTMIIENVGLELLPMIHDKQASSEDAMSSTSEEGGRWTSRLTTLHIHRCNKLRSLGSGLLQQQHLLRSFEALSIKSCDDVACDLPDGFKDLTALRDLSLYDCPKLLVDKFHASLRTLEISECFVAQGGWVDEYPFLFSVWVLKISGCSHVSLDHGSKVVEPLDWLSSMFNVYSLQLENTSFVSLNMFDKLHSLETLEIDGSRGAFFDGSWEFEWLEKLHTLSIRSCSELCELPENLYTLPALEELSVDNCPAIQALPANGLPASLKRLSISKCSPELVQRCLDDELDRPKIAKVGVVYIDGQNIAAPQE